MHNDEEKLSIFSWQYIIIGFLIFIMVIVPLISRFFGKKEIGAFFEAPLPYNAEYYVHIFPGKTSKNYKVSGDIYVDEECYGPDCTKYIQLETAHFNHGSINFEDCYIESGETSCTDNNGEKWRVEFYGEKVR